MDIDHPRIPYQKVTLAEAVVSGIARQAQCRVDRDGVERCYHPESGSYWESPGPFPAAL
jgi:hypothetical protein